MSKKQDCHAPNKARGFGLTAELDAKKAAKFDADLTNSVIDWMKEVLIVGNKDDPDIATLKDVESMDQFAKMFKDGRVLCKVVNIIYPCSVKKINKIDNPNSPFKKTKETENISNFLNVCCEKAGCKKDDLFQTVDLYEAGNIPSVVDGIAALGRKAHGCANPDVPAYGPKESTENKREFTQEQLDAGKNVIGLQMGTNECASQAGQNFGKCRAIID